MSELIGKQLGNYRLIGLLGQGGFANVYLGEHVYLAKRVAVKVLHSRLTQSDIESFLAEARMVVQLEHPHIIQVIEFGVTETIPYLVMTYAPNGSVRQLYPKGTQLPLEKVVNYVDQVASALQYAHDTKLIHRDIKPENMLLNAKGEILLGDFGIATIARNSMSKSLQDMAGTVAYMAPEQLQGKPRFASDQYSLGIVVYEWLAGHLPFNGALVEIATQHLLSLPPPLRDTIPSLPEDVEQVVKTALAKNPQERFASVSAFAKALKQAAPQNLLESVKKPIPPTLPVSPQIVSKSLIDAAQTPTDIASSQSILINTSSKKPFSSEQAKPLANLASSTENGLSINGSSKEKSRRNKFIIFSSIALLIVLLVGTIFAVQYISMINGNAHNGQNGTQNDATNTLHSSSTSGITKVTSNTKVALVTDISGLNDNGFNQLAYTGYKKAESQYGFKEQVIQTQSQNDYLNNLTTAAQMADVVIAVGFLMEAPLDQVAKQFPSKKFSIVDGCATDAQGNCDALPNVAPLFFKEQEAGCLVGAIAGQMEVDGKAKIPKLLGANTIAAIGGLSIPPVNRYIAGYKYCAQKVDPTIKVVVNYSQDFATAAKCKDLALSQINQQQADIVFQVAGGCGIGAFDAANQKGVYGIGVDSDQSTFNSSVITSALKRVDVAVYDTIKNVEENNFSNNPPRFSLANGGVGYAPVSAAVPADAKAQADTFASQIQAGSLTPPENIP